MQRSASLDGESALGRSDFDPFERSEDLHLRELREPVQERVAGQINDGPPSSSDLAAGDMVFTENRGLEHERVCTALNGERHAVREAKLVQSLGLDPKAWRVPVSAQSLNGEKAHHKCRRCDAAWRSRDSSSERVI